MPTHEAHKAILESGKPISDLPSGEAARKLCEQGWDFEYEWKPDGSGPYFTFHPRKVDPEELVEQRCPTCNQSKIFRSEVTSTVRVNGQDEIVSDLLEDFYTEVDSWMHCYVCGEEGPAKIFIS